MNKLFGNKQSDFETEALQVHNEYRKEHGVPPLVLNKEISKLSQKWAEDLAKRDALAYSLNKDYGESVYCGWSSDSSTKVTARDCVEKWYSEIKDFSFGEEPELLTCGHFTQIVWKETKELGIGSAKSKSGKLYVVANYSPPGNYSGQFAKNVPPPGAMEFAVDKNIANPTASIKASSKPPANKTELAKQVDKHGNKFEQEFLQAHNEYRKKHNVPPLVISKKLNKYAEEWAQTLVEKERMEHRKQNEYGENIYFVWSTDPNYTISGRDAVDKWYSEIKDHVFGNEPTSLASGHFTQVIWADSKEVGWGMARSKDGKYYVVANYSPPGNVLGHFAQKVPPLANTAISHSIKKEQNNNHPSPLPAIKPTVHQISEKFQEEFLKAHNDFRKNHNVPPLVISKKLNKYAEEWAHTLVQKDKIEHRKQNEYGENIYFAWSNDPNFVVTGKAPVEKWYSEIKNHVFGEEPTTLSSGHFTQVIWADSKEVGYGMAKSKDGKVYVVANYFPPGNVFGLFAKKVPPPSK